MEIFVSTAEGVCDFISAMDTARIPEWNTWYHLMNCGFPLKLSGETDFPCMSSRRVGASRASAQWCAESVKILWRNRHRFIKPAERPAAKVAYDRALKTYERIAAESP